MKLVPLSSILSGFLSASKISENFQRITTAFNNTLSRDGSSPNSMLASIDMNSNRIINVGDPVNNQDAATKAFVSSVIAAATFGTGVQGAQGIPGPTGPPGTGSIGPDGAPGTNGSNGWSPICSIVTDSARRVIQITDWTGGTGTKPTTGLYVGASGLTGTLASAVDIRGPQGTSGAGTGDLLSTNNLSDVANATTARANLGVLSAATHASSDFALVANNLADMTPATMRSNLGLGTAALQASTVFSQTANNLSDLTNTTTARANLGVGVVGTKADLSTILAAGTNVTLSTTGGVTTITCTATGGGASPISFVGENHYSVSGTSQVLTLPTGSAAGDVAIVMMQQNSGTYTTPTGWTDLIHGNSGSAYPGGSYGGSTLVCWKQLSSGDISTGSVTITTAVNGTAAIFSYRNMNVVTLGVASASGSATTLTAIGFTKTGGCRGLVFGSSFDNAPATITPPSGPISRRINSYSGVTYVFDVADMLTAASYTDGTNLIWSENHSASGFAGFCLQLF